MPTPFASSMPSAATIRSQIEARLGARIPAPFAPKATQSPELLSTDIPSIDAALGGGVPRGCLTEINGEGSTGRTGLALAIVAAATRRGTACAWVDVRDALDPQSAAACGVILERVLWMRAGEESKRLASSPGQRLVTRKTFGNAISISNGHQHPRHAHRGMERAVASLFRGESNSARPASIEAGTTLASVHAELSFTRCAESQPHHRKLEVSTLDRFASLQQDAGREHASASEIPASGSRKPDRLSSAVHQSLRATDLLLQAGGFGVVILDMCGVAPQYIQNVPLGTWYRFRLGAEHARTALVLLTDSPCAKSCAAVQLRCERDSDSQVWSASNVAALFTSQSYRISVARGRMEPFANPGQKMPPASQRASWTAHATWTR